MQIKPIDKWIKQNIMDNTFYVLRDRNNVAHNVSYTEEGLKWTTSKRGDYIFFAKARMVYDPNRKVIYFDQVELNPEMRIEKFVPTDHYRPNGRIDVAKQIIEYRWVDKATRLLYMQSNQNGFV